MTTWTVQQASQNVHHQSDQRELATDMGLDHARGVEDVRSREPGDHRHAFHPGRRNVPVTVAGTVAQTLAESLAGMTLAQLVNPGARW